MTDHSALIERLEAVNKEAETSVFHVCASPTLLAEAAAALRDLTEWRDIATAPKDGSWFLACWAGPAFAVVQWDSCDWIEGDMVVGEPDGWLPLPSAPDQAKEAGE